MGFLGEFQFHVWPQDGDNKIMFKKNYFNTTTMEIHLNDNPIIATLSSQKFLAKSFRRYFYSVLPTCPLHKCVHMHDMHSHDSACSASASAMMYMYIYVVLKCMKGWTLVVMSSYEHDECLVRYVAVSDVFVRTFQ